MTEITYDNAVDELYRRIPEFRSHRPAPEPDLPHDVFGTFSLFLCDVIANNKEPALVARALQFLDEMTHASDEKVLNLLIVSVLEIIADDPEVVDVVRKKMTPATRALLDRAMGNDLLDG